MNYRNQWPGISGYYTTYTVSYDQHFDALSGGIGCQVMYDVAGDGRLTSTSAAFIYSYHLNISDKFTIKAALQTSVQEKSIDFSKLHFGDEIHPRFGFIQQTNESVVSNGLYKIKPFIDFSAGIMGFSKKFYSGLAVHHINQPKYSFLSGNDNNYLSMKITSHVGMLIPLDDMREPENYFSPNILFQMQGDFLQINLGGYYIKNYFIIGLWMRQTSINTDAFMILAGIKKDPVKFGYSYDATFSNGFSGGKGSHEISFIITIKPYKKPPSTKWRKIICPSF